jgi:hypothetical protein
MEAKMTNDEKPKGDLEADEVEAFYPNVSRTAVVIGASPKDTLLGRAVGQILAEQEELRLGGKPAVVVVGASPIPCYPRAAQWSRDLGSLPDEEPIGIDINALPDMTKVER